MGISRLRNVCRIAAVLMLAAGLSNGAAVQPASAEPGIVRTFTVTGAMEHDNGRMKVDIVVDRIGDYEGDAFAVFELVEGHAPLLLNAVPVQEDGQRITQYYDEDREASLVKVFIVDRFDDRLDVPVLLASPVFLQS